MLRRPFAVIAFVLITLLVMITFVTVLAQSGSGYDLTWNTIDNGGGTIGNGSYTLNGTIGQADASTLLGSGGYTLAGGFWNMAARWYPIYLPLTLRGS